MKFINKLKLYTIYIVVGLFTWTSVAAAELSINEIMYDGAGADIDWLEVYNNSSESVDLTALKLFISNSTANHEINISAGSKDILPGGFGLIVVTNQISNLLAKWPNLSPVFTSSFSLPNLQDDGSATISINRGDKNQPIDSVTYSKQNGASDNDRSLQLIENTWQESVPTPNQENQLTEPQEESKEESNNQQSASSTASLNTSHSNARSSVNSNSSGPRQPLPELKIFTKINTKNVAVAGIPFMMESETTTNRKTTLMTGRYLWNFGDGTDKEVDRAQSFSHIYYYPGEYVVNLAYYQTKGSFKPVATDRLIIKVIAPAVIISGVGNQTDTYVELENQGAYELDLSGFIISSLNHYFVIPSGTIILPNKKIKLSSLTTGFNYDDLNNLLIKNPDGQILAHYPKEFTINDVTPATRKQSVRLNPNVSLATTITKEQTSIESSVDNSSKIINLDNLGNLAASSSEARSISTSLIYSVLGLVIVMTLGIVSYFFIKKSNVDMTPGSKSIQAKDFTIIE